MEFIQNLLYFIITLGILVFVHELGHFLAARLCRMRVDRFSIGMGRRAFGKKLGDTDYCVSWVPIGGYVKIAGMIDENFDTDFVNQEPQPYEFRARPLWQRAFVLVAGVAMNILLAIAIFWGINHSQGKSVRETTLVGFVDPHSAAAAAGFVSGDRIQTVNGEPMTEWDETIGQIFLANVSGDVKVTVVNGTAQRTVTIPRRSVPETNPLAFGLVPEQTDIVIRAVEPGRPADALGLKPMDVILRLNGQQIGSDSMMIRVVRAHAGKELQVEWKRGNEIFSGSTVPSDDGRIGVQFAAMYRGPQKRVEYSVFGALPQAIRDVAAVSGIFVQQIGQLVTGQVALKQSIGGPIRIAQMATQQADLGIIPFLWFMALLSVSLALLNILPVPALDGGHLIILLIEGITRREIPPKVKIRIQWVGVALLILLMVVVTYNDISRVIPF